MKLYYCPGVSSLAAHIAAKEGRIALELVKVDLRTHRTDSGDDFLGINPRGYVPALKLSNGALLTEVTVILEWLADEVQGEALMPSDTIERHRVRQWLSFIATEIHKQCFYARAEMGPGASEAARGKIARRLAEANERLGTVPYLAGESFTVADAYLFTVLNWMPRFDVDLDTYPHLKAFAARMLERPAVRAALSEEGILDALLERIE
jgi:glutathione S-transferase